MFHFLSSIYRTSFPFFLFSTAASLVWNFYSCILKMSSEFDRTDVGMTHWFQQWRLQIFVCFSDVTHRSEVMSPITFQLFGFIHSTLSISFFLANIKIIHWIILRIKRCDNSSLSLHFNPSLQSALWSPICKVQSTFYTDCFCLVHLIDKWFTFLSVFSEAVFLSFTLLSLFRFSITCCWGFNNETIILLGLAGMILTNSALRRASSGDGNGDHIARNNDLTGWTK